MKQNIIIKADGTELPYEHKLTGKPGDLEHAQKAVGGLIQIVYTKDKRIMIINEEGKLDGLPINPKATALYQYGEHDPIVGDVLVMNKKDVR